MTHSKEGVLNQDVQNKDGSITKQKLHVRLSGKELKKGWNMTYKDPLYDFLEKLTKSQFKLYRFLEQLILSQVGVEAKVEATKLASGEAFIYHRKYDEETTLIYSPTKDATAISKMLTIMVRHNMIMETSPKHYRFNPLVILPQFADGEHLQKEWKLLQSNGPFKRRGRNILDEYYDYKKKTRNHKLKFEDWLNANEDVKINPGIITESKQEEPKTNIPDISSYLG